MPKFSTEVPNPLGREQAKTRLQDFMEQMRRRYQEHVSDLDSHWSGDTLTFSLTTFGFQIAGQLQVEEEAVRLNGSLPLAAAMFRGQIERSLADELRKALADGEA